MWILSVKNWKVNTLPSKNVQTVSVSQILCYKINSSPRDLYKLTLAATLTVTEWQFHSTLNAFHTWIVRAPSHFVCILFPMLCLSYLAIKVSKGLVGLLCKECINTGVIHHVFIGKKLKKQKEGGSLPFCPFFAANCL